MAFWGRRQAPDRPGAYRFMGKRPFPALVADWLAPNATWQSKVLRTPALATTLAALPGVAQRPCWPQSGKVHSTGPENTKGAPRDALLKAGCERSILARLKV